MSQTDTAAFPPPPRKPSQAKQPDTQAPTMMAPQPSSQPTIAAGPAETQPTMMAPATLDTAPPSAQATIAADGALAGAGSLTDNGWTIPPGGTHGYATVLPDVRNEGDNLIIVPRNETRYQSEELLGRGGMGEVKLAVDQDIGRKVAVKRLLDERSPHAVARFIDEVRTVGALEHPNIVPIHDVGVDENGSYFFVMKYVEGETLSDIIAKLAAGDPTYHKRYPYEVRLDLFVGLLRALQYAHARGLVHRDIKPENIMVGPYGEIMVMDWGIAHHMRGDGVERRVTFQAGNTELNRSSTETVDGSVIGTPQYMSPEQAAGKVAELDGRSDLYSACIVLYELLSLQTYVEPGDTAMQTVVRASERQPPHPVDPNYGASPYQSPVPIEWRHYLQTGLANDRDKRYQTAEEALSMLEHVRAGDLVACPVTFMKANNTKMERFMDRHPLGSLALAAATILTFLGGVAGWVMWGVF